ncbi:FAM92 protein [Paraphysoderma sedebokerense]|nr:FAM92 protein [Paraphysoderma sedebokerense]
MAVKGQDEVSRFVRQLVDRTEENMAELKDAFGGLLRNHERLKQKSLKLALVLKTYADQESPNVKMALNSVAEGIQELEKNRKWMQDRIDIKSREPLGLYSAICKGVMDDLKVRELALKKEVDKQQALDKIQVKDGNNRTRISQGQIELAGANHEANHSHVALAETVERFELKKINDIKSCLQELLYSEMVYHAKALEILTDTMAHLSSIDMEMDVEEIQQKVRPNQKRERYRQMSV